LSNFVELPVTHVDAIAAGRLPLHHRDPFDRMLVAQGPSRD
jgi:PIN domain nuclease of toxin-antitoxin system